MSAVMIATAAALIWFGMVCAISFIEAPLKFQAPGITIVLGLGIGKLVFGVLNICEALLLIVVVVSLIIGGSYPAGAVWLLVAAGIFILQMILIRPRLRKRTLDVLANGPTAKRSRAHLEYAGVEIIKAACLIVGAIALLTGLN